MDFKVSLTLPSSPASTSSQPRSVSYAQDFGKVVISAFYHQLATPKSLLFKILDMFLCFKTGYATLLRCVSEWPFGEVVSTPDFRKLAWIL